jgi:hypothetical protein
MAVEFSFGEYPMGRSGLRKQNNQQQKAKDRCARLPEDLETGFAFKHGGPPWQENAGRENTGRKNVEQSKKYSVIEKM